MGFSLPGFSCCRAWALGQMAFSHYSSQALQHRLRGCCKACGIFPDQGSNPCPQYWKEHSLPLSHQGSPNILFLLLMVLFCSFHFGDHILWVGWRGGTFGFGSMVHSKTLKQWFCPGAVMWLWLIENGLGGYLHLDGKLWEETERKWKSINWMSYRAPVVREWKRTRWGDGEILQIFNVFS